MITEFDDVKPIYSRTDVADAIKYAFENVLLHPDEIGFEVYMNLFKEKFNEYLYKIESIRYEST